MNYKEAISYISQFQFHGFKLGLERIDNILKALGYPHKKYPCIHVAGTNGKGSTCAMITSILTAYGFKVGLYTSPHLTYLEERFRIGLNPISKREVVHLISQIKSFVDKGFELSYFEFTTAMAFLCFAQKDVDIAVVEVGLGGRLDATNVITPKIGVITNIAMDHMSFLGDDLESIAYEKAGIIKPGMKIINASKAEAKKVIRKRCIEKGAEFYDIKDFIRYDDSDNSFDFLGFGYEIKDVTPSLLGKHQLENTALSIASSVLFLEEQKKEVDPILIKKGLSATRWPARLEPFKKEGKGVIVLDGAHNKDGVDAFLTFLTSNKSFDNYDKKIILMACSDEGGDKAFFDMFNKLKVYFDIKIITQPPGPRKPVVIERWKEKIGFKDIYLNDNYKEALKKAISLMEGNDLLVVIGSLYLAGAVREDIKAIGFREFDLGR